MKLLAKLLRLIEIAVRARFGEKYVAGFFGALFLAIFTRAGFHWWQCAVAALLAALVTLDEPALSRINWRRVFARLSGKAR